MIYIEVKHDTAHNKFHRLSIGFHDLCALSIVKDNGLSYVDGYAKRNQMNPDQLAFRIVDRSDKILYMRESAATENRPK